MSADRPIIEEYYSKLISRKTDLERLKTYGQIAFKGFSNDLKGGSVNHSGEMENPKNTSPYRPITTSMKQDYQLSTQRQLNFYKAIPEDQYVNAYDQAKLFKNYYRIPKKSEMNDIQRYWKF